MFKRKPNTHRVQQNRKKIETLNMDGKHTEVIHKIAEDIKRVENDVIQCKTMLNNIDQRTMRQYKGIYGYQLIMAENTLDYLKEFESKEDYYYNVVDIMYDYVNVENDNKNTSTNQNNSTDTDRTKFVTLTDKFFKKEQNTMIDKKNDIIIEYYRRISPIDAIKQMNEKKMLYDNICAKCNIEKHFIGKESARTCLKCGDTDQILLESSKFNYNENKTNDSTPFRYRKITHFDDCVGKVEAKNVSTASNEIIDIVRKELTINKDFKIANIKPKDVRKILQKYGLTDYYKDTSYIVSCLTVCLPPTLSETDRNLLRIRFRDVENVWKKIKTKDKKAFMSYSYVIRKLLELMGKTEYLAHFSLSNDVSKINKLDNNWMKICKALDFQFIRTKRRYI